MMFRIMSLALVGAVLGGCFSSSTRTEPPAPVYEKGRRVGEAMPAGSGVETTALSGPEISLGVPAVSASAPPAPESATSSAAGVSEVTRVTPSTSAATDVRSGVQPAPVQLAYRTSPPPTVQAAKPMSSAGQALVAGADAKLKAGDLTGAAAYLERAVRLDPNHPLPWNRLAHVRLAQGSYGLARELAGKSNALAGDDGNLKRNNWLLIAEARRAEGDTAGAEAARRQADEVR